MVRQRMLLLALLRLTAVLAGLAASLSATEKRVEIAERGRREAQTNWEAAQAATERLRGESLSTRTASAAEVVSTE